MGIKKSVNITNIESNPITALHKKQDKLKCLIDTVEVATTDLDNASNDYILFGPIPSNSVLVNFEILSDDLDSNGSPTLAYDIGLYYSGIGSGQIAAGKISGDVIDADCIGTAVARSQSADVDGGDLRFEADDIANIGKELWEIGGLTSDVGGTFYIGLDLTTAAATPAAGTITIRLYYI